MQMRGTITPIRSHDVTIYCPVSREACPAFLYTREREDMHQKNQNKKNAQNASEAIPWSISRQKNFSRGPMVCVSEWRSCSAVRRSCGRQPFSASRPRMRFALSRAKGRRQASHSALSGPHSFGVYVCEVIGPVAKPSYGDEWTSFHR